MIFGAPEAPTKGGGTLLLAKTLPNPLKKPWFLKHGVEGATIGVGGTTVGVERTTGTPPPVFNFLQFFDQPAGFEFFSNLRPSFF